MKLERLPEPWLDPESVKHANEMFYGVKPQEYFSGRLGLLILAAGRREVVEDALREGISYEGLTIGGQGDSAAEDEDPEDEAATHRRFVIAETLTLLHHASETLIRFYLAHEPLPESPWIAMASELPAEAFKRKVRQRFDGKKLGRNRRKAIARVFYGSERPLEGQVRDEDWDASLDNLESWLGRFAARFLDEANVWNAVKHGLVIQPGEPSMQVRTPADEAEGRDPPLLHATGPAVTFLEKRGAEQKWHVSTRWLSPFTVAHLMGEIHMACRMLEAIWKVGRLRYLGEPQQIQIFSPIFDKYMGTTPKGVITNYMSINMLYRYAYPPELVCTDCSRRPREGEQARLSWRMYRDEGGAPRVVCRECARARKADEGPGHEAAP